MKKTLLCCLLMISGFLNISAQQPKVRSYLEIYDFDTKEINQCNNDHVISADGKWIALSSNDPANVFYELDVYWAVVAGVSPVDYMQKYAGRFEVLHIKDKREVGQSGMVGFDAIFRNFKTAGTQAFVVEMEEASTPNILKGLRESALYLRNSSY